MQAPVVALALSVSGPSEVHSRDHQMTLLHPSQAGREHCSHPQRGKYCLFVPTGVSLRLLQTLGLLKRVIGDNPHFCPLQHDRSHQYPRPPMHSCLTGRGCTRQPVSLALSTSQNLETSSSKTKTPDTTPASPSSQLPLHNPPTRWLFRWLEGFPKSFGEFGVP